MSWEKVKEQTETLTKSFEDFKKVNDAKLADLEKGKSTGEIEEKLTKYDDEFEKIEKKLEGAITALNRKGREDAVSKGEIAKEAKGLANELHRKGTLSTEKLARFMELNGEEYKLLSVQNDHDGGYGVRPQMSNEIQKHLYETSPMRQLAETMSIGSDSFEELYEHGDEVGSGWVGETQSRPETDAKKLNMLKIPVHEIYAEPRATQKLLDDSFFDVESWHQGKVISKFERAEAEAFISGDGILRPKGIVSYASGDGFNKVEQVDAAGSSTIVGDDLIDLQDSLYEQFQMNAVWLMKRATRSLVRKLKDSDGRYLFSIDSMAGLNGGQPFMLLDKPIHLADDMPAVATDALPVAYGDFRQGYKIVDRIGIRVIRDALTLKGFVKFYTTKRVGGGVQQFQAIKLLKTVA